MIRKLEKTDVDKVANLWLEANLTAHDFISEKYWKDHFNMVKEQLLQAEVYIEYSYAAEPPVQFRLSHLSRRSEPL